MKKFKPKTQFDLLVSGGRGMSSNYSYENYVEYCKENNELAGGKESQDYYDWVYVQAEFDYDCFFDNLHYAKIEKEDKGFFMITFELGLWNGTRSGYIEKVFTSATEAIKYALQSSRDYLDYRIEFDHGFINVYGYHHDGTNIMTIKRLSKHGEQRLLDRCFPDYEKYVQRRDTFKKLDWQFAWT